MSRTSQLICLLAIGLGARNAGADASTPNFLPFGERASMLGNAGITSSQGEAVYYNPANLGRIDYPSLSVSGSTFLLYEISIDPYISIDGEDQPFAASGFVAIPSALISTYQIGTYTLATAILVPDALTYKSRQTFTFANERDTSLTEVLSQSMWLGGGIGREIVPGLYAGVSGFVRRDTSNRISAYRAQWSDGYFEQIVSVDQAVLNLVGVLGIQWQPSNRFGVGLRAQLPSVELTGSQDRWSSFVQADAMGLITDNTEQEFEDLHASNPSPTDLGLGISARPHPKVELMLDVGVQLPATYTVLETPMGNQTTKYVTTMRANLGMEIEIATNKWLRAGAMHTPMAVEDGTEDYTGGTLGFSFLRDRTITSIGV
ncbi:MAG: hypothetical protein AB7L28_09160, partial [Kofleriaceae bacterium]